MRTLCFHAAGVAFSLALLAGAGQAQTTPQLISFQGLLADSLGQPLPDGDPVHIRFAFYGQESGGQPYLSVLQEDVATDEGRFALLIGSGTITPGTEASLADVFQKHGEVWLGMEVGGDGEMTPRTRIGSVPYAVRADDGVPKGGIIMWSGTLAAIPAGWRLCDGTGGTPDLRDRFVMGTSAGQQPGGTGGSTQIWLSPSHLPVHSHGFTTGVAGGHQHSFNYNVYIPQIVNHWIGGLVVAPLCYGYTTYTSNSVTDWSDDHTHSGSTGNAGGYDPFSILPPYYKLAFIMKL
jgi:microcystin-dependent protein